jgi:hypothetical protein
VTIDLLRTQVKDLLDWWTDRDDVQRPALLILLAQHLQPVRMADSENNVKSKITGGPAPWDDPVAHLLADVSSGTRTIERGLDIALGFTPRQRGGSDGNTRHALGRIPDLTDALDGKDGVEDLIAEARVTIGAWHRGALLLLGAERRWAHIRTEVNEYENDGTLKDQYPGVAVCPFCESPVRIQPDLADEGDVERHLPGREKTSYGEKPLALCVDRTCLDDNGQRRSWPVDAWLGHLLTWKRDTRVIARGA